jgi:acyl-CoA synthetase (AMP-forming)/AMP-acid ligase II
MEKIWLQSYPPGVPAEISIRSLPSLVDAVRGGLSQVRRQGGLRQHGAGNDLSRAGQPEPRFRRLVAGQGFKKGDRVALMMPNLLQYPVALFGTCVPAVPWSIATRSTRHGSWNISSRIPARRPSSSSRTLPTRLAAGGGQTDRCHQAGDRHADGRNAWRTQGNAGQFRRPPRQETGAGLVLAAGDQLSPRRWPMVVAKAWRASA